MSDHMLCSSVIKFIITTLLLTHCGKTNVDNYTDIIFCRQDLRTSIMTLSAEFIWWWYSMLLQHWFSPHSEISMVNLHLTVCDNAWHKIPYFQCSSARILHTDNKTYHSVSFNHFWRKKFSNCNEVFSGIQLYEDRDHIQCFRDHICLPL